VIGLGPGPIESSGGWSFACWYAFEITEQRGQQLIRMHFTKRKYVKDYE